MYFDDKTNIIYDGNRKLTNSFDCPVCIYDPEAITFYDGFDKFIILSQQFVKLFNCAAYIKSTNRVLIFEKNSIIYTPLYLSPEYIPKIKFVALSVNNKFLNYRFANIEDAVMAKLCV